MNAIAYRPIQFRSQAPQPSTQQTQADIQREKLINGLSKNLDAALDRVTAVKEWTDKGNYYPIYSADKFAVETIKTLAFLVGPVPNRSNMTP